MILPQRLAFGIGRLIAWFRTQKESVTSKVIAINALAMGAMFVLMSTGFLGTVFSASGFALAISLMAALASVFATATALHFDRTKDLLHAKASVSWMEYIDNAILAVGFIGMLYGAILELTHLDPTATGAAVMTMLKGVFNGVGIAIYSVLAASAATVWTTAVTRVVSNAVDAEEERRTMTAPDPGTSYDDAQAEDFERHYTPDVIDVELVPLDEVKLLPPGEENS